MYFPVSFLTTPEDYINQTVSRMKLYAAKICAVAFFVLANLLMIMLLSLVADLFLTPYRYRYPEFKNSFVLYCYFDTYNVLCSYSCVFLKCFKKRNRGVLFINCFIHAFNVLSVIFPSIQTFLLHQCLTGMFCGMLTSYRWTNLYESSLLWQDML